MKRIRLLLLLIITALLSACEDQSPQYVDIVVHVQGIECTELENGMYVMGLTDYDVWDETFLIEQVEVITSEKFEFPYETEIIDKNIDDVQGLLQPFWDSLNDIPLHATAERVVGSNATLVITLTNDTHRIDMNFYDNLDGDFTTLEVEFYDDDTYLSKVVFDEEEQSDLIRSVQEFIQ